MADVTGPISSMPGALHTAAGDCDDHPGVKATRRVQGETDSMGCEMLDMCDACYAEHVEAVKAYAVEEATGCCDWCNTHVTTLRNRRDYDEGMSGRIYQVCLDCVIKENKSYEEEVDKEQHRYFE